MNSTLSIFNAVHAALYAKQSTTLNYVQFIYKGWRNREDIPKYPVIIIEPAREPEGRYTTPNYVRNTFEMSIMPIMEVLNPNNQITGDNSGKGILEIVADIKNILSADKTLGGVAIKLGFPMTSFYFEHFPYRYAEITLEVEYIAQDINR